MIIKKNKLKKDDKAMEMGWGIGKIRICFF
jgi:hypothetical protein